MATKKKIIQQQGGLMISSRLHILPDCILEWSSQSNSMEINTNCATDWQEICYYKEKLTTIDRDHTKATTSADACIL
uniref:Uncharacterized protein n=1 Tax=Vespula pensylvanica TaxID=30213 RepID=A0A834NZJ7_VESPE|nr:hypothetical protein H0235_008353 [Vespula pensylvanica]